MVFKAAKFKERHPVKSQKQPCSIVINGWNNGKNNKVNDG